VTKIARATLIMSGVTGLTNTKAKSEGGQFLNLRINWLPTYHSNAP